MHKFVYYNFIKPTKRNNCLFRIEKSNLERLFQQLRVEIKKIYPETLFLFLSGHFAYDRVDIFSDIDISLVLKDSIYNLPQPVLLEKRKSFTSLYKRVHKKYNVRINDKFPGEIATESMIDDIIAGRGFQIKNNKLFLTPILKPEDWLKSEELDFRAWMGIITFNNNKVILGNKRKFFNLRFGAFLTVLKFLITQLGGNQFSYLDFKNEILTLLIRRGKPFLGIDETLNPTFSLETNVLLDLGIDSLIKQRFLTFKEENFLLIKKCFLIGKKRLLKK